MLSDKNSSLVILAKRDPIDWVLAHAGNVRLILELSAHLNQPDELTNYLQRLIVGKGRKRRFPGEAMQADNDNITSIMYRYSIRLMRYPIYNTLSVDMSNNLSVRMAAMTIIQDILNSNLRGMSNMIEIKETVLNEHESKFPILIRRLEEHCLLDFIYWLASESVLNDSVRFCNHCGNPFAATHRKARYCPPRRNQGQASPCMNRAKQARYKRKQKGRLHAKTSRQS